MRPRRSTVRIIGFAAALAMAGGLGGWGDDSDEPIDESNQPTAEPTSGQGRDTDLATAEFALSWQDALKQAQQRFDGDLQSIGLDWEQTQYAYTVKLASQTEEYEVEIAADSGDVLGEETDTMDGDDAAESRAEIVDTATVVPWTEARDAALGVADGRIDEWKLEGDQRGPRHEFDVVTGSSEDTEVAVDARSGEVIGRDD